MIDSRSLQIAILLWGSVLEATASVCMFFNRNYEKNKRKWMICMQSSTAIFLAADSVALVCSGMAGTAGYVIVKISNLIVYMCVIAVLLFFHEYLFEYLKDRKTVNYDIRRKIVYALCIAEFILVIVSQFTDLYYYVDSRNFYNRGSMYWLSTLIPAVGMLIDFFVIIQYRKMIGPRLSLAMCSYILMPLVAALVQLFFHRVHYVDFSIGAAMFFMLFASIEEQNIKMRRLLEENIKTEEQLEISTTLNRCISELVEIGDIHESIYNLLEIVNGYFNGDRSYTFDIDYDKNVINNTDEYFVEGITSQIDNLRNIPISVISEWMVNFKQNKPYYVSSLNQEKGTESYDVLDAQDIDRLLAVPLIKDDVVIGFLGVDNPRKHCDDATLLSSIQYFITEMVYMKKQQENLEYLSYRDVLTGMYNRNKYMDVLDEYKERKINDAGVAFFDLNGLKMINDKKGHKAGDTYICLAAGTFIKKFPENAYRIGGDEFVIIMPDVNKTVFECEVHKLQEEMQKKGVSISMGYLWRKSVDDMVDMLNEADRLMYEEKKHYYQSNKA